MNSIDVIRDFLDARLGLEAEKVLPEVLLTDLGVDSLTLVELMFEFEDRFNITLDKGLERPATVGDMALLMDRLRSQSDQS